MNLETNSIKWTFDDIIIKVTCSTGSRDDETDKHSGVKRDTEWHNGKSKLHYIPIIEIKKQISTDMHAGCYKNNSNALYNTGHRDNSTDKHSWSSCRHCMDGNHKSNALYSGARADNTDEHIRIALLRLRWMKEEMVRSPGSWRRFFLRRLGKRFTAPQLEILTINTFSRYFMYYVWIHYKPFSSLLFSIEIHRDIKE